jgi:hypothetical protein
MTVLTRASTNLTDRLTFQFSWESVSLQSAVRVWGWREMVASLQGLEPGSRGTSAVGSRYRSTWLRALVCVQYWFVKCSHEPYKCPINPIIYPKPVYSHSIAWQYLTNSNIIKINVKNAEVGLLLSPRLLLNNVKIKMYKTIILFVVLYGRKLDLSH